MLDTHGFFFYRKKIMKHLKTTHYFDTISEFYLNLENDSIVEFHYHNDGLFEQYTLSPDDERVGV